MTVAPLIVANMVAQRNSRNSLPSTITYYRSWEDPNPLWPQLPVLPWRPRAETSIAELARFSRELNRSNTWRS